MQNEEGGDFDSKNQEPVASVSWEASEYLQHDKDLLWVVVLVVSTTGIAALSYIILKDVFSVVLIVLVAVAFGVYAFRKPRTLSYQINADGLYISGKLYRYDQFSSFSILDDGGVVKSLLFDPVRRLMPPISIYYQPENEEHIKEVLSKYLPYRQTKLSLIDKLFNFLRF